MKWSTDAMEKTLAQMTPAEVVGNRVRLNDNHPHSGKVGRVTDYQPMGVMRKQAFRVDLSESLPDTRAAACYADWGHFEMVKEVRV